MTRTDRLKRVRRETAILREAAQFTADLGSRADAPLAKAAVLPASFQAIPAAG